MQTWLSPGANLAEGPRGARRCRSRHRRRPCWCGVVVATVEVDEVVPFDDPRWSDGELFIAVVLGRASDDGPAGFLSIEPGPAGAVTGMPRCVDVDQTSSAYVLTAAGDCVRGLPRSLTFGAIAMRFGASAELDRALVPGGTVHVLGGTAALSDAVLGDVRAAGFHAERVAGSNRFETAVEIAREVDDLTGGHDTVLLADGRTFTDALVAGAVAPTVFDVVLLTDGATTPPSTSAHLANDEADRIAIGSTAAAAAPGARSIIGTSPSTLSANVVDELTTVGGLVAVASQSTFADALAGGAHVGWFGAPLLLTDPASLSDATRGVIDGADDSLREVVVYGGTAAVAPAVVDAIEAALAP